MKDCQLGDPERRAQEFRQQLGLDSVSWIDPMTVLVKLKRLKPGFDFALVNSTQLPPNVQAQWDSKSGIIKIRDETFYQANRFSSIPRARYAIFHEVVHVLDGHAGRLNRSSSLTNIPNYARRLKEIETWTERVTAAFIAPAHLIAKDDTIDSIAFRFGLSTKASMIRHGELFEAIRPARKVPDVVVDLLLSLGKRSS